MPQGSTPDRTGSLPLPMDGPNPPPLHAFFLPFLTPGHMLPMVDMARLFAEHGVRPTIVTTPLNVARIAPSVDHSNAALRRHRPHHVHDPIQIQLLQIPFPSAAAGLPSGWENLTFLPTPDLTPEFHVAIDLLRQPFDLVLRDHRPDFLVADSFYGWATDSAEEFGIPRLVFYGTGYFSLKVASTLALLRPHDALDRDEDTFVVPGIPHRVEVRKSQLPLFLKNRLDGEIMKKRIQSHRREFGTLMNTFYDLEPDYVGDVNGARAWHIGPLSLCNRDVAELEARGDKASIDTHDCLRWLDGKEPHSVIYLCFGSLGRFIPEQFHEISLALQSCGHPFIWVIKDDCGNLSAVALESPSYEKGLIIRGWAPQILILNHPAVGGFVTHCGWNSVLEGVCAGVPLVAWPLFAEQCFNERYVVDVLRVGVGVGVERCSPNVEERGVVGREKVAAALERVMSSGEEAAAMRRRAEGLAAMGRSAVDEGGDSHESMRGLIADLTEEKRRRTNLQ